MPRSFLVRDDNNATCNGAGVVDPILRLVTKLDIQTFANYEHEHGKYEHDKCQIYGNETYTK